MNKQNNYVAGKASKARSKLMRSIGLCFVTFGLLSLGACSSSTSLNKYGVKTSKRVYNSKGKLPKKQGYYKVGKPYKVAGKWYYPREDKSYNKTGMASWYGDEFHGRKTANGEIFDMHAFTGAHKTLPLPSLVKVTNISNGKVIIVRINDRGPYHGGRILDMSRAAADALGYRNKGLTKVRVEYFGKAAPHASGDKKQIAALGGKSGVSSKSGFFDSLFGGNKQKFVPKTAPVFIAAKKPNVKGKLTAGDMLEFDPDVASAVTAGAGISSSGAVAMARSVSIPKNQGRILTLDTAKPIENVSQKEFVQVAMFNDIKQAVEYKKQLGQAIFSKIDIQSSGGATVYLVMVEA